MRLDQLRRRRRRRRITVSEHRARVFKAMSKKIPIPETTTPAFAAGSHKLLALQKHQGIVKPSTARKMEKIESWIKHRQRGRWGRVQTGE
jgi:hypothetical protein